jgi:hypothetical protein
LMSIERWHDDVELDPQLVGFARQHL